VEIDPLPWHSLWHVSEGIAASLAISILARLLPLPHRLTIHSNLGLTVWRVARPYVGMTAISLLLAIVALAFGEIRDLAWYDAMMAGYAADATMQKLIR